MTHLKKINKVPGFKKIIFFLLVTMTISLWAQTRTISQRTTQRFSQINNNTLQSQNRKSSRSGNQGNFKNQENKSKNSSQELPNQLGQNPYSYHDKNQKKIKTFFSHQDYIPLPGESDNFDVHGFIIEAVFLKDIAVGLAD